MGIGSGGRTDRGAEVGRFREALACPCCRGPLDDHPGSQAFACEPCGRRYPVCEGVPVFLTEDDERELASALSRYRRHYNLPSGGPGPSAARRIAERFLKPPRSVEYFGDLSRIAQNHHRTLHRFLSACRPEALTLDLGSGTRRLGPGVINIDIDRFANVAIVASGNRLPFADGVVDAVVAQNLLEHVAAPARLVDEIYRVLKPGGRVYCETPFLFPVHGDSDYYRYTPLGLAGLFSRFEPVESGVCMGPGSVLALTLKHYAALVLTRDHPALGYLARGLIGWLTFPIKYLDRLLPSRTTFAEFAGAYYHMARKPADPAGVPPTVSGRP